MSDRIELDRVRERRSARRATTRRDPDPGTPAMVGRVASPASAIAVGKFLKVHPVTVLGAECEGCPPSLTAGAAAVPVLLLGPRLPATGDDLICRFERYRWVAEKTGGSGPGGGGGPPLRCPWTIPATIEVTCIDGQGAYYGGNCQGMTWALRFGIGSMTMTRDYHAPTFIDQTGSSQLVWTSPRGQDGSFWAFATASLNDPNLNNNGACYAGLWRVYVSGQLGPGVLTRNSNADLLWTYGSTENAWNPLLLTAQPFNKDSYEYACGMRIYVSGSGTGPGPNDGTGGAS